jgi:hypothetical protein
VESERHGQAIAARTSDGVIELNHDELGKRWLYCDGTPELLFTENDTNTQRLFNFTNGSHYFKDGINEYIVHGNQQAVNPEHKARKQRRITSSRLRPAKLQRSVCG